MNEQLIDEVTIKNNSPYTASPTNNELTVLRNEIKQLRAENRQMNDDLRKHSDDNCLNAVLCILCPCCFLCKMCCEAYDDATIPRKPHERY